MTPLPDANRRTVSISTACASVGVTRRTMYNWIRAGKVEWLRIASGAIRIYEDSLWREAGTLGEKEGAGD